MAKPNYKLISQITQNDLRAKYRGSMCGRLWLVITLFFTHLLYPKEAVAREDWVSNMFDGEQLRDYLPVKEVSLRLTEYAISRNNIATINICMGKLVSVRRLVEHWLAENQWDIKLNLGHHPLPGLRADGILGCG